MIELQLWVYLYIMAFASIGAFKVGVWLVDLIFYIGNKFAKKGKDE